MLPGRKIFYIGVVFVSNFLIGFASVVENRIDDFQLIDKEELNGLHCKVWRNVVICCKNSCAKFANFVYFCVACGKDDYF